MNFSDKSKLTPKTVSRRTEAPRGGVLRKAVGVGGAAVLAMASSSAFALLTGTDANLSMKAAAGGMAGAAYTKPQEASAALFGNPATMTQFGGTNFNLGAGYIAPTAENTQSGLVPGLSNTSTSGTKDYAIPDLAVTHELGGGWYLGTGVEADAGLGADFRNDPITIGGVPGTGLPLVVELLSFNINLAAAKKLTPQTSVGAALTVGFGLAQLGTAGPTSGLPGLGLADFGGTTSSVHNFGVGGSLGITHQLTPDLMLSGVIKSPVEYNFKNILHTTVGGAGFQDLKVEQPLELVLGGAYDLAPGWMVEADLAWKNWSKATTYQDVYKDQFLLSIGTQYKTGPWSLRMGYSYAEDILRDEPNDTLGGLTGLGTVPLGGPLGTDVVKLAQTTLVPVLMNHTLTAGAGYDLSKNVRLDVFAAYAFKNDVSRATALGNFKAEVDVWAAGLGLNFKF
jgi:long-chain fatty acid transport protein